MISQRAPRRKDTVSHAAKLGRKWRKRLGVSGPATQSQMQHLRELVLPKLGFEPLALGRSCQLLVVEDREFLLHPPTMDPVARDFETLRWIGYQLLRERGVLAAPSGGRVSVETDEGNRAGLAFQSAFYGVQPGILRDLGVL